jgi:hypothetical protein
MIPVPTWRNFSTWRSCTSNPASRCEYVSGTSVKMHDDQLTVPTETVRALVDWAFEQALGAVWYYAESNPAMSWTCRRTLERIEASGIGA